MDNRKLIEILHEVPTTDLEIIHLSELITDDTGHIDLEISQNMETQLARARSQAHTYTRATRRLLRELTWRINPPQD